MSNKGLFKSAASIASGHVKRLITDVTEGAKTNAKENHNVDLNIIKPNLKKVVTDLVEWNNERNEKSRLSREELKTLAKGVYSQAKSALMNEEIKGVDEDDFESFLSSLDEDLEDIDFDDKHTTGNESENMDVQHSMDDIDNLEIPDLEVINLIALSILMATADEQIQKFLTSDLEMLCEMFNVDPENSDSPTVQALKSFVADIVTSPEEDIKFDSDVLNDAIKEDNANMAYALATTDTTINEVVGMESDNTCNVLGAKQLLGILHHYQKNENFNLTVDRVLLIVMKVINSCSSISESQLDINVLDKNMYIHMTSEVFEINEVGAISFYVLFSTFVESGGRLDTLCEQLSVVIDKNLTQNENIGGIHNE